MKKFEIIIIALGVLMTIVFPAVTGCDLSRLGYVLVPEVIDAETDMVIYPAIVFGYGKIIMTIYKMVFFCCVFNRVKMLYNK